MIPAGVIQAGANLLRVAPDEPRWRFVSQFNRTANQVTFSGNSGYQTAVASRVIHRIGSGDVSVIKLLVPNWSVGNSAITNTGNSIEVLGCYLENIDTGASVKVTFGGADSVTIADLDSAESDPISASSFGLSAFPLDARLAVRSVFRLPLSGVLPQLTRVDSSETTSAFYNSTSVSCTNLSGTGALAFSGTATPTFCPSVILLGKFTGTDQRVWLGIGDSILEGAGDAPGLDTGAGFFTRGLRINKAAGLNMGKPSGNTEAWVTGGFNPTTTFFALVPYANGAVCENGTNRFDGTGNGSASNRRSGWTVEWGLMHFLHQAMDTRPGVRAFKIIRTLLMPRCVESGFSDSTQTILGPKWDAGGDVELWNTQMQSDVGVFNRADAYYDPSAVVRRSQSGKGTTGSDWYKWAAGMCGDGTHPTQAGHTAIATPFAASIAAVG